MKQEEINRYTTKLMQANQSQLVVIIYELTIEYIELANQSYASGEITAFKKQLEVVRKCIRELIVGLNHQYKLSSELLRLYIYMNKQVIEAHRKENPEELEIVTEMLTDLKYSFEEVAKQDTRGPLVDNVSQVYAGLTYGKGTLNEMTATNMYEKQGFKA